MEIRLLGPVRLHGPATPADLGPRRQRFVLGVLALEVNRAVTVERLIDLAWPDGPPRTAAHAIRVCVSGIRQALAGATGFQVVTVGSGYMLRADADHIDVHRFRAEVARAHIVGTDQERIALLEQALDRWAGPPLDGVVPAESRELLCRGLEEARLSAQEDLFDAQLRLGGHPALLDRLAGEAAAHPLRERLIGQLMLALYRAGRAADALAAYRRLRERLADELGIDPGAQLRQLEVAILRADPSLDLPATPPAAATPTSLGPPTATPVAAPAIPAAASAAPASLSLPTTTPDVAAPTSLGQPTTTPVVASAAASAGTALAVVPAQLPTAVAGFVGREEELRRLGALAAAGDSPVDPAMTLALVVGTAGVGKTTLAVHWAHSVRDRYPDGQLYLNLRGFDTDQPVPPLRALATMLTELGVPPERVPSELDRASAMLRSLLAGRRVLVLLDNAATAEQVRPLLPGTPGSTVIVTSRAWLTGLIAVEGAHTVPLDPLPAGDAVHLLGQLLDPARDRVPGQLAELARLCARLPLALRIAAAHLRIHPMQSVEAYLRELTHGDRLAILSTDDQRAAVRATFGLSYRRLCEADRILFRLLGVVPGPDVTAGAAAALLDVPEPDAAAALDRLAVACLVQQHRPGRYQPHDLLRLYATELAAEPAQQTGAEAARRRLHEWYLEHVTAAAETLYPHVLRLPDAAPAGSDASAAMRANPRAWLRAEQANLTAAVTQPAGGALLETQCRLADALRGYLMMCRDPVDWHAIADAGLRWADALGAPALRVAARLQLGSVYGHLDDPRAEAQYAAAAALAEQAGWRQAHAAALSNLAQVHVHNGDLAPAVELLQQALPLQRRYGPPAGQATVLTGLGLAYHWRGEPGQAAGYHAEALELYRVAGARGAQASAAVNLAYALAAAGDLAAAQRHTMAALPVLREVGIPSGEALALDNLARIHRDRGELDLALRHAEQAVEVGSDTVIRVHATAMATLASCHAARGDLAEAVSHYTRALDMADMANARYIHTEARLDLARALGALGRHDEARNHARAALDTAERHGFAGLAEAACTLLCAPMALSRAA